MDVKILDLVKNIDNKDLKEILQYILKKLEDQEKELNNKANRQVLFR